MAEVKEIMLDWLRGEMTPEQWRQTLRIGFVLIVLTHITWAGGYISIPGSGASGFAFATEVEKVREQVVDLQGEIEVVQVALLRKDIEAAQERICLAAVEENNQAMRYSVERRNQLVRTFMNTTGDEPIVPTCEELGIHWMDDDE